MAVNVPGLVGIIFFYIVITAFGAILTYRSYWLTNLWSKITALFRKKGKKSDDTHIGEPCVSQADTTFQLNNSKDGSSPEDQEKKDIALAGRSIGLLIGSFTLTAGWVGGAFISGTAEEVYKSGLLWTQAPFAYSLSLLVGGLMFSKKMRSNKYVTMLDPFQNRYGNIIGSTYIIPAFIAELFWSLSLLTSLATILSVVVGIKVVIALVISASIAVVYTMFGGLALLANTDLIQLTFIFLSLWICIPVIFTNKNVSSITQNRTWLSKEPLKKESTLLWIDSAIYLIFGGIPWQTYFQKILSCKSTKVAYYLSFTTSFFCLMMAIPALLIGAAATTTDWSKFNIATHISQKLSNGIIVPLPEYVLPATFVCLLPPAFLFICLGSVAASTISSTDSSMLSAATMISHNFYKNVIKKNASNKELAIVLRIVIFITGVIAVGISFLVSSVYGLWFLSSDLVYIILFPRLCAIVYLKFTNSYGGIAGSLVGSLLRILFGEPLFNIPAIINLPPFNNIHESLFPYKTTTMIIGFLTDIIISYFAYYLFVIKKINPKYDFLKMLKSPDFSRVDMNYHPIPPPPHQINKNTTPLSI